MNSQALFELQKKLQALGINLPPETLMMMGKNPQLIEQYTTNRPLLGGGGQPQEPGDLTALAPTAKPKAEKAGGGAGTWDTAMIAVAQSLPIIMSLMRPTGGYAPATHMGGKYPFSVPQGIFPQRPQPRSLLASYLR